MFELVWEGSVPLPYKLLPLLFPIVSTTLFFLPFVLTSFAIAIGLFYKRKPSHTTLWEFLFPRRIFGTKDFRTDVIFFFLNQSFYPFFVLIWVVSAVKAGPFVRDALQAAGFPTLEFQWGLGWAMVYTLSWFVARDFGAFIAHFIDHNTPLFWQFHKVHHTTRALNPFSAFRFHPLDDIFSSNVMGIMAGLVVVVFTFFFGDQVNFFTILGAHVCELSFRLVGYHLRHSHIWWTFGPILGYIFISPAHHQVHHSRAQKHFNKNLGQVLAIWDWMFGTLYMPNEEDENIDYGIPEEVGTQFTTVRELYFRPFKNLAGYLITNKASAN